MAENNNNNNNNNNTTPSNSLKDAFQNIMGLQKRKRVKIEEDKFGVNDLNTTTPMSTTPTTTPTTPTTTSLPPIPNTPPTLQKPFVPRVSRLHPDKKANAINFMHVLISGEDADFKIALHDTDKYLNHFNTLHNNHHTTCIIDSQHRYIAVHSFVLKNKSGYFSGMLNANMKESAERWTSFNDFDDQTVMDALECIYSCSVSHMMGSSAQELGALISLFAYIDLKGEETVTALFHEVCKSNATQLLLVLEYLSQAGVTYFIPEKTVTSIHQHIAKTLTTMKSVKDLGEGLKPFCTLDEKFLTTLVVEVTNVVNKWEDDVKRPSKDVLVSLLFALVAVWTSYDPATRIPHTMKLLKGNKVFTSIRVRGYTIAPNGKRALSMHQSADLQLLPAETMKNRAPPSSELVCQLSLTLMKLDRDALLLQQQEDTPIVMRERAKRAVHLHNIAHMYGIPLPQGQGPL